MNTRRVYLPAATAAIGILLACATLLFFQWLSHEGPVWINDGRPGRLGAGAAMAAFVAVVGEIVITAACAITIVDAVKK